MLEPAFQAGKHVGGGDLMAMMLNLFAFPRALEASVRLLFSGGGGMVHRAPFERTKQKFYLPQEKQGAPSHS